MYGMALGLSIGNYMLGKSNRRNRIYPKTIYLGRQRRPMSCGSGQKSRPCNRRHIHNEYTNAREAHIIRPDRLRATAG